MMNLDFRDTLRYLPVIAVLLSGCSHEPPVRDDDSGLPFGSVSIPPSAQRLDGDPEAGYHYLIYGDYMNSGIPYEAFMAVIGPDPANYLNRAGDNAPLTFEITAVDAPNGVRIVAQNCLKCHGSFLNDEFIIGLGAQHYDYTFDYSVFEPATTDVIRALYGANSPEMEAYEPFRRSGDAIGPYLVAEVMGVNPADKIWTILSAYRDPWSLDWHEEASAPIEEQLIPTDVPPWWLLKKKNAMFYSAYGRQDFTRIMMASSLLTLKDSTTARQIDGQFKDIYAYLRTIEPPAYPWEIDPLLSAEGRVIFERECASCHGTYGESGQYPNLLIDLEMIGTDDALANSYYRNPQFVNWFNDGWFGQGPHAAKLVPTPGYIAPPLDGIWASAPYLHNGSVPTLSDLLYGNDRPTYWYRSFRTSPEDYDTEKVGWKYQARNYKVDKKTYDTTHPGYHNGGHYYGNYLADEEKTALLEYLKTL